MAGSPRGLDAGPWTAGAILAVVLVSLAWVQVGWSRGQADLERARWLARVQADATLWGAELDRSLRALQRIVADGEEEASSSALRILGVSEHWSWVEIPPALASSGPPPIPSPAPTAVLDSARPIEALRRLAAWLEASPASTEVRFLHPVLVDGPGAAGGWAIFPVASDAGRWKAGLIPLRELMVAVAPGTWQRAGVDPSVVRVAVTLGGRAVWPMDPAGAGVGPDARTAAGRDLGPESWEGRVRVSVGGGPAMTDHEISPADHIVSVLGDRSANTIAFGPGEGPASAGAEPLVVHATPLAGSVEALARSRHRRDLGVSVILLLAAGGAGGLLMLTTHRARMHARRQAIFAATVSHELRTPLAGLRGALENLRDGIGDPEAYRYILESQLERLEALSEDALLSAEGGGPPPAVDSVSLAGLVQEVVSLVGVGASIEVDVPTEAVVSAPRAALTRAVCNLVSNALLHGRPPIRLAVRPELNGWLLEVCDEGPGLGPGDSSALFEPFCRGSRAVTEATAGSGLGLAVVRRVVESVGGTVSARNGADGGAVFALHLRAPTS